MGAAIGHSTCPACAASAPRGRACCARWPSLAGSGPLGGGALSLRVLSLAAPRDTPCSSGLHQGPPARPGSGSGRAGEVCSWDPPSWKIPESASSPRVLDENARPRSGGFPTMHRVQPQSRAPSGPQGAPSGALLTKALRCSFLVPGPPVVQPPPPPRVMPSLGTDRQARRTSPHP